MNLTYSVVLTPSSRGGYLAEVPALTNCQATGETLTEALLLAEDAINEHLNRVRKRGFAPPRERPGMIQNMDLPPRAHVTQVTVTVPGAELEWS